MKNETRDTIVDLCVDTLIVVMLIALVIGLLKGGYNLIRWLVGQ